MDFSKFRASGDLSDITIVVDNHDNKLHKFPLYARSDYFCQLARSRPGGESEVVKLELENFPGSNDAFEIVADFCYNMPVSIDTKNVIAIRCASEYLRMDGSGNLVEISDRFIQDTISTAKLSRSHAAILSLLVDCNKLGEIAKTAGIVEACVDALVHCLSTTLNKFIPLSSTTSSFSKFTPKMRNEENSSPSAFTKISSDATTASYPQEIFDDVSMNCLVSIQSEWFALILAQAKQKGIAVTRLGALAVRYISAALERDSKNNSTESLSERENPAEEMAENEKEKDTSVLPTSSSCLSSSVQSEEIGNVIDTVILSLPEHAYSIPCVTMEWLTKVLRIATSHGCTCRSHLVRVAGEMLTRLGPEDLCIISPSVLHDIVQDASVATTTDTKNDTESQSNTPSVHRERACKLVDTYLAQMTSKGVLTAETFRLLASATKDYPRPSHDSLFTVLEFVIEAEKEKLNEDQRSELVNIINFDLISEVNLQRSLDADIAPPSKVACSAIKLCSKLRSEMESVKCIAEMQELDIQKYQAVSSAASAVRLSPRDPPPVLTDALHYRSYHSTERNPDSGYTDSLEPGTKSPDHDHETLPEFHDKTDALRAAQTVLTAARHKLALPVYTGHRPSHLTRYHSPTHNSPHFTRSATTVEHDITLEEELEFKFDRSFRSLDPRVRNHHYHHRLGMRDNSHLSQNTNHSSPRSSYFPYTSSSYRY